MVVHVVVAELVVESLVLSVN